MTIMSSMDITPTKSANTWSLTDLLKITQCFSDLAEL